MTTLIQRKVERVLTSRPTVEGGGVKLNRALADANMLDPFLLLDEFHSHHPHDYSAGFPYHPHRGFETVTYVLEGTVLHQDSAGNRGTINAGEVQWMTAGSGIVHQEIPKGDSKGRLWGLQLWINLPSKDKMTDPKYREIKIDQIPEVEVSFDTKVRVISGDIDGKNGPVRDTKVDIQYLDVTVQPNGVFEQETPRRHRAFVYILDGSGSFEDDAIDFVGREQTVIYGEGETIRIHAGPAGLHCLLISGEPINEPVAWRGSIVMNTQDELVKAYEELQKEKFLKHQETKSRK
jgi:redox-sensitive bicupin YhaK (pirin superfamily)